VIAIPERMSSARVAAATARAKLTTQVSAPAWVFAASDAEVALSAWTSSKSSERADAHAVHRAALDREECAAAALATAAHS
jgi:hypothetical protein